MEATNNEDWTVLIIRGSRASVVGIDWIFQSPPGACFMWQSTSPSPPCHPSFFMLVIADERCTPALWQIPQQWLFVSPPQSLCPVQPIRLGLHIFISSVPRAGTWLASRQDDEERQTLPPSTFLATWSTMGETLAHHLLAASLALPSAQQHPTGAPCHRAAVSPLQPPLSPNPISLLKDELQEVSQSHPHTSSFFPFHGCSF